MEQLEYFRLVNDSLTTQNDSLQLELFNANHLIGINELIIDKLSEQPKYKELKKDIDKEENSNNYE